MKWTTKRIRVDDLKEYEKNPRVITKKGLDDLEKSIVRFSLVDPLIVNTDFMICGGHARKHILKKLNIEFVDVRIPDRTLTPAEFDELNIRLNKNVAGQFDFDILANEFDLDDLVDFGFEDRDFDIFTGSPDETGSEDQTEPSDRDPIYRQMFFDMLSKDFPDLTIDCLNKKYDFKKFVI